MFSIIVLAFYLSGAAWLASGTYRPDNPASHGRRMGGIALGTIAVVLHAVLLYQDVFSKPALSLTMTESASLIGWPIGALALVLTLMWRRFAIIGAVLMLVAGIVAATTIEHAQGYALEEQNWEIAAHIVLSTIAYALLTIAVALAIALGLLDRRLRTRQPLGWLKVLPSMEALESGTFQALAAGFSVLTLALFSGFIFVHDLFAQHLIHKTVLSCLAWLVFGVLLFGHWRFGWRGRTATSWTVGGFALLGLAYFGSKFVLESLLGRHWG